MKHFVDSIQAYIDGELSSARRVALEEHCALCRDCARELAEARALWTAVEEARAPELGRSLWPTLRRRRQPRVAGQGWLAWLRQGLTRGGLASTGLATGALATGLALGLLMGAEVPSPAVGTLDGGPANDAGSGVEVSASTLADESATLLAGAGMTLTDLWVAVAADEENGT